MNSVRSNIKSLKYKRFTKLGSRAIGIINSEFVAKTQFLYKYQPLSNRKEYNDPPSFLLLPAFKNILNKL